MVTRRLIIALAILSFCCIGSAPASTVSYKYDSLNRLVEVLYDNTARIEYVYDVVGNCVSQTVIAFNLKGDINGDSDVNLTDAILALQIIAGLKPTVYIQNEVNNDGRIGLAEAIYAMQKVAGLQ
jgi:hypothetical protein